VERTEGGASVAFWLVAAALLVAVAFAWFALPLHEWADRFTERVRGLGAWGPLIFLLAFALATMILVPASAMALAGGLAFGLHAIPLALIGATLGGTASFLLSRHVVAGKVRRLLVGRPKAQAVHAAVGRGGWKMLFLLRLSPLMPFGALNYLLGATEMAWTTFASATFVGVIPAIALYVYLGTLGRAAIAGEAGGIVRWLLLILGLTAGALAVAFVARRAAAELARLGVDRGS